MRYIVYFLGHELTLKCQAHILFGARVQIQLIKGQGLTTLLPGK